MKNSKLIALSAIATAFSIIFMTLGAIVPALDYSGIFMASICVMLPLSKKSVKAALLTYGATLILAALLVGATTSRWEIVIIYGLFFGLHPTVSYIMKEKNFNKIVGILLKTIWFVGVLIFIYFFFTEFLFDESFLNKEWVKKYIYLILIVGGGVIFVVYDFLMDRLQRSADAIVNRLKL